MKFDLSRVTELENAVINSATLGLYSSGKYNSEANQGDKNKPNGPKNLHLATKSWIENSVNWNNYGSSVGTKLASSNNTSFNVWEKFNVLSAVKDMITDPAENYGFIVKFKVENAYDRKATSYASSENNNTSNRPKLTIDYTSVVTPVLGGLNISNAKRCISHIGSNLTLTGFNGGQSTLSVYSLNGALLFAKSVLFAEKTTKVKLIGIKSGTVIVRVDGDRNHFVGKLTM